MVFSFKVDNTRKFNIFGLLGGGSYMGATPIYIFRKFFSWASFASQIVCLYLEQLKSCKASKA